MPLYAWHLQAAADDETDAAIVAEVLAGALRDERNDPAEPVDVTYEQVAGDDVAAPADDEQIGTLDSRRV